MVARAGFSLIEAIVALTLLSVGLLALAATAGAAARITRESEVAERAVFQASQLLDSLASQPDPRAGHATAGAVRLSWTVEQISSGIATIQLSVRFADGSRERTLTFSATTVLP